MTNAVEALTVLKAWARSLIHSRSGDFPDTRGHRVVRWARIGVLILGALVALQQFVIPGIIPVVGGP